MISIEVIQYLKPEIRDPEGAEIQKTLGRLGYPIDGVSIGRKIRLEVDTEVVDEAISIVDDACQKFLVNPIIHDYTVSVV